MLVLKKLYVLYICVCIYFKTKLLIGLCRDRYNFFEKRINFVYKKQEMAFRYAPMWPILLECFKLSKSLVVCFENMLFWTPYAFQYFITVCGCTGFHNVNTQNVVTQQKHFSIAFQDMWEVRKVETWNQYSKTHNDQLILFHRSQIKITISLLFENHVDNSTIFILAKNMFQRKIKSK